jgi:hypothetical protein
VIGDFPIAAAPIAGTLDAEAGANAFRQPGGWLPTKPRPVILVDEYGFPYKPPVPEPEPQPLLSVEDAQAVVNMMLARFEAMRGINDEIGLELAMLDRAERQLARAVISENNKAALTLIEANMQEEEALLAQVIMAIRGLSGLDKSNLDYAPNLDRKVKEVKDVFDKAAFEALQKTTQAMAAIAESGLLEKRDAVHQAAEENKKMETTALLNALQQNSEAIQKMAAMVAQGQQAMAASLGQLALANQQLAATQMAPKRVVYDKSGTPVGVEVVIN